MQNFSQDFIKKSKIELYFEEYIDMCIYSKQLRKQTIEGYKNVFRIFLKIMPEIQEPKDLTPDLIQEFFKRLSTRKRIVGKSFIAIGVRQSTIRTYYNKLIIFIRWLEQKEIISNVSKVIVKPPTPTYEDERALSEREISKIVSAITLHTQHNLFLYKRDLAIVNILLFTGIRKGELLGLRCNDVDFSNRVLFINGETSKSKKSRKVPLHPTLIMHLREYLLIRKDRNATTPQLLLSANTNTALTSHGLKHWVKKYKKLSKTSFHLHRFRHTFACTLAKNNADIISIKNVMGHSSIKMTERYLRSIGSENARSYIETLSY
jgi:integrase